MLISHTLVITPMNYSNYKILGQFGAKNPSFHNNVNKILNQSEAGNYAWN